MPSDSNHTNKRDCGPLWWYDMPLLPGEHSYLGSKLIIALGHKSSRRYVDPSNKWINVLAGDLKWFFWNVTFERFITRVCATQKEYFCHITQGIRHTNVNMSSDKADTLSLREKTGTLGSISLRRTKKERTFQEGLEGKEPTSMTSMSTSAAPKLRSKSGPPKKTEPTYRMEPEDAFFPQRVENLVQRVLAEKLKDHKYDASTCKSLSQELAGIIMESLKSLQIRRYKMVAVVSIGSMNERPGLQFGSRCLWDQSTDRFASVKFTNGSLFAVALIYGLYYEWLSSSQLFMYLFTPVVARCWVWTWSV